VPDEKPPHEAERLGPAPPVIEFFARFRGGDVGRQAMLLLEDEARSRGLSRISLNVFGGNEIARSLYRSLGYAENAVWIGKTL